MLSFYFVNKTYATYLRQFDAKVPSLHYDTHDKFFCGVVMTVNSHKYYVPISHDTEKQQTSILIKDKGRVISSLKFAFMIPVPDSEITKIDFNEIAQTDSKYADLLRAEYEFCSINRIQLARKAESVYRIGCNKNHTLNRVCCNFQLLEEKCREYIK